MGLGLNGKRAIVTGSTAGIGFATARSLAIEGVEVTVKCRTEARVLAVRGERTPAATRGPLRVHSSHDLTPELIQNRLFGKIGTDVEAGQRE